MRKRGWRTAEWKLIEALEPDFHNKPPLELYNLIEDPGEIQNLADQEPELVETLRKRMETWVSKRTAETRKPDPIKGYQLGLDLKIRSIKAARNLQAVSEKKNCNETSSKETSERLRKLGYPC